ncbi:GP88 family protein [Streptacidiphilus jiangxiensis]|nr:hypothetical protein [Streptacidiphilus jiangxiensis]
MAARKWLLTQNSQLRKLGVFNWPLPAAEVKMPNGRFMNVCPSAGACRDLCYARTGTYRFANVLAAHTRNLMYILERPQEWAAEMKEELKHKRYQGKFVRLHDSGDFFSADYLKLWLDIMQESPDVIFYTYTKEVSLFREIVEPDVPANFRFRYSLGGREDRLLDLTRDRHAEVFPDEDAVAAAAYETNSESDLVAASDSLRVGMPANPIRHLQRLQGRETFGEIQRRQDTARAERLERARAKAAASTTAAAVEPVASKATDDPVLLAS